MAGLALAWPRILSPICSHPACSSLSRALPNLVLDLPTVTTRTKRLADLLPYCISSLYEHGSPRHGEGPSAINRTPPCHSSLIVSAEAASEACLRWSENVRSSDDGLAKAQAAYTREWVSRSFASVSIGHKYEVILLYHQSDSAG